MYITIYVYKTPCKDCDATYIGESKRSFKVRSSEHMRAVRNMDIEKKQNCGSLLEVQS